MPNTALNIAEKGLKSMNKEQEKNEKVIDIPNKTENKSEIPNNAGNRKKFLKNLKEYSGVASFLIVVITGIFGIGVFRGEAGNQIENLTKAIDKMGTQSEKTTDNIDALQDNLKTIQNDMKNLQKEMDSTREDVASLHKDLESLESDMDGFKNSVDVATYYAQPSLIRGLSTTALKSDAGFLATPSWKNNEIIAQNRSTGRKYKARELRDKKLLIPYEEEGQDAYFLGQYNKKNQWDGNCLINTYKNKKLTMIMEGRYKDGQLISYQQVNYYKNASKEPVWSISERKKKENVNTGETYTYHKVKNKKASFTKRTVESSDILSVADFKEWLTGNIEGYYYGNTKNGAYNDDTGNAYLIKYTDQKTVRTLYCGNFKNGAFEDNTGNAWYISYDFENSVYVYFKGKFTKGRPVETKEHKRENITIEKIHRIIDTMHFNESVELCENNAM